MRSCSHVVGFLTAAVLAYAVAASGQGMAWRRVAELTTGGEAKSVALNGAPIARLRLRCVEGAAIINAVAVLEGEARTTFTVARRLASGDEHVIELGAPRNATALRISDAARGRYEVYVNP